MSEVLKTQANQTPGNYLENLELEYKTIDNPELSTEISNLYASGRSLSYEHVTLMKTVAWSSSSRLINENINIPHKSM